jgi:uncharacterized protein YcnI
VRRRRLLAAATATAALAVPSLAQAHVSVTPAFVEADVPAGIAFEAPNERAPQATVELSATAPPGIEIVSADAPPGWQADVAGSTVTWTGGRIEGERTVSFPVRVLARVRAGTYAFKASQRYSDGGVVRWQASLTVLPAKGAASPQQNLTGAIVAGIIGLVVIAGSLLGVRLLRRRHAPPA